MKKLKSLTWIILLTVANNAGAQLVLERSVLLGNYPSGSSIEFYNNKLYVVGDDATQLMILNTNYKSVDSTTLFNGHGRISKSKKPDIEASAIIENNLLLLGSSSTPRRELLLIYPLQQAKAAQTFSLKQFNNRLKKSGLNSLNFEGMAVANNQVIIGNRGHIGQPYNQLVITEANFWSRQKTAAIHIANIHLATSSFAGISGLTYIPSKDLLLFTASTENTTSTYLDGDITDSYIGWVTDFSKKMSTKDIKADKLINLAENNQSFKKQKIESVTVQEVQGNTLVLHLIADNDNGQTTIFQARLTL